MKEFNTHDHTIEDDADIIELGVASVETKGRANLPEEIDQFQVDSSLVE
ncbi:benenodin family lasso peptide [Parvularcula flava]|uniref:Benenodin family lasso peptide n=1 Tax=Aquisalinus luteolus TaxID=1566827 RepID=A0A8J3A6C7_9PROT|nr:benenodin family lasso peptide [Aquisalinus luteolus]NHK27171.1 benenodin family lasso peptide [Aquisalinus luteolus]GGH94612.1 hypothetical protein GCM10011355_09210 [Aquisalinus luteolus]